MPSKHTPPTVLVADDETSAATMLRHIFEHEGYHVEIAHDGVTAFEKARSLYPDLIILDVMMPKMDGFEVLKRLRDRPDTSGIPTIVVSARAKEPSDVAKGINIGADDYMVKPFAPQELLARARSKMRAKQLEETLQQRTNELESLLQVSEELNRHLEIEELLSLILQLSLDLLPGEFALICRLDSTGDLSMYNHRTDGITVDDAFIDRILNNIQGVADHEFDEIAALSWLEFPNAMVLPLDHGEQRLGFLLLASHVVSYDANHQMLFRGVTRQAALALHNAELYEVQANYALHLEDMVAQRTEELKATQQMLLRSEKLASIGHLASSIAHEINNPLQPIRLNLEFLLEDAQSGNPADGELIGMTQSSVERISRIVRQLLEFAKPGSDSSMAPVDVNQIIESVVKLNARAFERDKIKILVDAEPLPTIAANKDQLEQVFMNLMINAKAAMEPGGKMHIRSWHEVGKIRIQFEDTGTGIPEGMIDKIFDPFVSTKKDGTGLGLFVTYGIIENHQGEIDVRSRQGVGTTFTITLPDGT